MQDWVCSGGTAALLAQLELRRPSVRIPLERFNAVPLTTYEPWMTGTVMYPDAWMYSTARSVKAAPMPLLVIRIDGDHVDLAGAGRSSRNPAGRDVAQSGAEQGPTRLGVPVAGSLSPGWRVVAPPAHRQLDGFEQRLVEEFESSCRRPSSQP